METEFNPQESESQETENRLNQEEGQLDGAGSWDNEESFDVTDPLEDNEEAEVTSDDDSDYTPNDEESYDSSEEDPDFTSDDDSEEDDSEDQKNTPSVDSNRVLSFEDFFRN